jgi:hypothetical protein
MMAEGFKLVECRPVPTRFRGTLLLHAGRKFDDTVTVVRYSRKAALRLDELGGRGNFWDARERVPSTVVRPPHPTLAHSAVVATVRVVGCHENTGCCRPWHELGRWHWELDDVQALTAAVACPGSQGLWRPSTEVLQNVRAALPAACEGSAIRV